VSAPSGLTFRILGPAFSTIVPNAAKNVMTIRGTTDWKQYQATATIPPECQCLGMGVRLYGKGKLWVDDIRYEEVKE
jgi:hypothetical protein